MDKEIAKKLLPWINSEGFDQHLQVLFDSRINYLYKQLETCDPETFRYLQGQIKELKYFRDLPIIIRKIREDSDGDTF